MEGVILAAGRGERLRPLTDHSPKPLISFKGKPLVVHGIEALMASGVGRVIVVAGYRGDVVEKRLRGLEGVDVVVNPAWRKGNASSFLAAEPHLRGRHFVLSMSDHLYPESLVRDALEGYNGEPMLVVDRTPWQLVDLSDATKVKLGPGDRVVGLGKDLEAWDGVDAGVFVLPSWVFSYMDPGPGELSGLMGCLIDRQLLVAFDGSGVEWVDLDTLADMQHAEAGLDWV